MKKPKRRKRATPALARRKGEREARTTWILDVALELAVRDGIGAVTITGLAKHIGYTVGAFYRYFPSLEALLAALHQHTAMHFYTGFFEMLGKGRSALAARNEEPRIAALSELVMLPAIYRRMADAHPRHFELVNQLVTRPAPWINPDRQRALDDIVLPRVIDLVGVASRAAHAGALVEGDAIVRMMTLWLGAHAALAVGPLSRHHPGLLDRDVLLASTVRSLLAGWGATAADIDASHRVVAALIP